MRLTELRSTLFPGGSGVRTLLASMLVILGWFLSPPVQAAAPVQAGDGEADGKHVLFIAGRPSHGYGSHEHYAGCRLLADVIASADAGVTTSVVRGWPEDESLLDQADSIVIYCDGGGGHIVNRHMEKVQSLIDAGKGFVCLHYAVEVPKGPIGDQFVTWLGGYFETHWSVNPHWVAEFTGFPNHPISQGVAPFSANDEWYFHMRFVPEMQGITPVLSAIPPETTMRRPDGPHSGNPDVRKAVAKREPQVVAWTYERPDGGRSFGYTGGHFHWNWGRPEMQRLVANAIVWTAGADIPANGVGGKKIGVTQLKKDQDYDVPERFDAERVAEEFKLGSIPIRPGGLQQPTPAKVQENGKAIYTSPVITSKTPGHAVDVDIELDGASELFLVVDDAGNGFSCDWADWIEPTVSGDKGQLDLTKTKWVAASSGWGRVRVNANAGGGPLSLDGKPQGAGIGTHANSVLHFKIPEGYRDRFTARVGLDTGGTSQGGGASASVRFSVYRDAPPAQVGSGGDDHPSHLPENALAGLEWPDDLEVTLAASEPALRSLTNLDIDDRGRIWVLDVVNYRGNNGKRPEGDRILILEDVDQDGVADEMTVFYQGRDIDSAMGICVLDNEVIVSAAPYIWKFTDTDRDDHADTKVAMFTETGQPQHDHSNHSFLFGPDGKLYWNVGNTGKVVKDADGNVVVDIHGREIIDNGKPFFGGMPFRCDLDGSNMEVLAHNFRNNWETTVDSFGTLWQSDNDDDGNRGVRINFVMEHGNYGYRDEIDGSGWRDARINMEKEVPLRHWHLNDPGVVPNLLQTGAGSPTGITVYEGRLLPERFWDQVLHCDAGPNVVRAYATSPDGAGYSAEVLPILKGTSDQWFRPADVCVAPDGSLFVTDWYDPGVGGHRQGDTDRGRLFRIAPPGQPYVVPTFDYSTPQGAVAALRNPCASVRFKAWMALHKMGTDAEPALLELFADENPRLRARALWLLGKIPGREQTYVTRALNDDDADIRATAIRLARQTGISITDTVAQVTSDSAPQVLREAAIALRFDSSDQMPKLWAQLAAHYDGQDRWYLEALGIASDLRPVACFEAWQQLASSEQQASPAGRDLAWRVRAPAAAAQIARLLTDPELTMPGAARYFRALEFHPVNVRDEVLGDTVRQLAKRDGQAADRATADALLVRSLERAPGINWRADETLHTALKRHAARIAETPEFIELVKAFRLVDVEPQLLQLALANVGNSTGVEATNLLMGSKKGREWLAKRLADDETAEQIVQLLGAVGNQPAVAMLQPLASDTERPYAVRAAVTRTLAGNNLGTAVLLELAATDKLAGDVKILAGGLLSRSNDADVRRRAAELLPLPVREDEAPLPPVDQLARMRGDVKRGEVLFRGKATCANCHIVSGFGKQVGPDLSEIGDKLPREALLISILDPSAGISHNYENYLCLLDTGQVITGVLVSETEEEVTLRTSEAIDRVISRDAIESLKKSDKSIMPENLHHAFDQQGLVDIIEYLTTLRKASN